MKKIIIASTIAFSFLMASCDDLFEPAIENNLGMEFMYENATYAEGVLGNAYTRIPLASYTFSEVATDDAVSNNAADSWRMMAAGTWTAENNPADYWGSCNTAIMYINLFLANADKVHWANDTIASSLYLQREKGEAYGLRAMYMYFLLRAHAGYSEDGELLGFPIVTEPEDKNSNHNVPRNTFKECVDQIYADCNKAIELLPTEYGDLEGSQQVPTNFAHQGVTQDHYNRVCGSTFVGRMCGKIAEAIRAKTSLLAASPAYNDRTSSAYQTAADNFAIVLDRIGGTAGLDPTGNTWYCNKADIEAMKSGNSPKEILWRGGKSDNNTLESDNYPPSIYGNGRVNPTQNFVDAFPAANGYPITDRRSNYHAYAPYENRDPRLALYVVFNGSKQGNANTEIITAEDGTNRDALNNVAGVSTRTGYYLRKLLRPDVNLDPQATSTQYHYIPYIRYTEMFLSYAEAANEAYGPTGTGSHAYSAYDVIKAIRQRAGIGEDGSDPFLEEAKVSKERMRELIRNERRIELSFEGFRFWDLRRWKENLNETAKGMTINRANNTFTTMDVDVRNYKDYMYYGSIPYSEILKFSELKQNKGW